MCICVFSERKRVKMLELRQLEASSRYEARSSHHFGCTPRPSSEVSRTSLLGRPIKGGARYHDPRYFQRFFSRLLINFDIILL